MAILNFIKPDKVSMVESTDIVGKFEFFPLEPGFGITIGNAIRRILLSSLEGFAISSIKFDGVQHEFSTIKGIVEDVTEIILNLKKVRFKQQIPNTDSEKVTINLTGQESFTAADIGRFTTGFQVLNPDLVICTMEKSVKFKLELTIMKGRGYVPSEENKPVNGVIGIIAMDSIFTPVKHVKYSIENCRVEQKTDYEKLILELVTDGSIHPKAALTEAAKILIHHFMLFSDEKITFDVVGKPESDELDEAALQMRQLLKSKLIDLNLSVRALNCLKAAEVETLGDLVQYNKNDLLKFRNFGKKSLAELESLVSTKGLTFGMDVSRYQLDKN
ncbi:MAG: DNA-directed RNA polymerase subunit alpha [Bacteroidetes bacterium]|nr:DNA-directed RNA polymerase subunit alpha [Bacteroidota bacterium]